MARAALPQTDEEAWEAAAAWGSAGEMSPFETLMWRAEGDSRLSAPVTVVDVLDRAPDWGRLVAAHEWGSRLVPRARQRVVDPPLQLGAPVWATGPDFDLHHHLRRARVPPPGSLAQVLELAEKMATTPFDRARPLWEALLVGGLEGGRAAYVVKIHPGVTDGMGGIQLLGLLHSRRREPSPRKPMPPPPEPEPVSPLSVLGGQMRRRLRGAPGEAGRHLGSGVAALGRLATEPADTVAGAVRFGRSLQRVLAPPPVRSSPLLRGRSLSWRFGALECGVDQLRAAGGAAGGTLGDAYVAALLGGFRRYHEHFGVAVDELPMAMPLSLRRHDHPMGGNRFAGARLAAPVGEPDPAERIRLVHDLVLGARAEPAADALGLLAPALNLVPTPLITRWYAAQTGGLDLQASNVPGIPHPVYIAGARIERMYPFGPLPGCAVMTGLVSHVDTCCIGVNCDAAAVIDVDRFVDCLGEGLAEVLALAPITGG
ncbi:MAG TPA: wax ester/triacylglycerol synthase domain-containing protein [Candidatus Dormibacteraeota bacterium]|nr:wax ester/triacylglycerol synthase domain-containing protein [Candidatus Dormibacteraeota bacterium]